MFDNGCEWIRCDFHLHTRKDKEFKYTGEDNSFVSDYVNKLESEKIKIGVITNHNKFDLQEYKALKKRQIKKIFSFCQEWSYQLKMVKMEFIHL